MTKKKLKNQKNMMRILAIVKDGENKHQLRRLIEKGHTVIMKNTVDDVPYREIDIVVSLSEKSVEDAFNVAQRYNIPFYAHIDWIMPWMVFKDSEYNWGYINKIPFNKKMNFIRKYQNLAMYWCMADVKSMSADCFHGLMREITGIPDLNIYTKHPVPNVDEILKYKTKIVTNQIACVSRFVPHKRVQHLIKALRMIDYDGTLRLIGSGEDKSLYEAIKGSLKIRYDSDLDRYGIMAESKIVISLWNGTVPAEAMLLGIPVITYESEYMKELYGDNISFVQNNAISNLAREIKELLLNPKDVDYEYVEDDILEKLLEKAVRK